MAVDIHFACAAYRYYRFQWSHGLRHMSNRIHAPAGDLFVDTIHRIGTTSITRVTEQRGPGFAPEMLFPDLESLACSNNIAR